VPPLFLPGTIFIDQKAAAITGISEEKPKYFIGMNEANDEDDRVVCFVLSTENNPEKLKPGCNKDKARFFCQMGTFKFQTKQTSIMLHRAAYYYLREIVESNSIKQVETVGDQLARQKKTA
jgi:hypothetical protein